MELLAASLLALLVAVLLHVLLRSLGSKPRRKAALVPGEKVELALVHRENISPDTRLLRFALPHVLGLPVGQHVTVSYTSGKEEVARPYTPTSSDDEVGVVDLVIKVYFRGVNEKFPDGGVMSQHMETLKLGDKLTFEGPKGRFTYKKRGVFAIKQLPSQGGGEKLRSCKHVGMIAGGTGITPMLQVIKAVLKDPGDTTQLSLLFANQTEDDILCRSELDALAAEHSNLKVHYTLDRPTPGWSFSTGFITPEMVASHLPAASKDTQVLVCGPPPMIKFACRPAFDKLGFRDEHLLIWHNAEALFLVDCGRERTFSSEGRGCDDVEAAFIGSRWWQPAASGSAATAPHAASACAHAALPPPPHAADRYG